MMAKIVDQLADLASNPSLRKAMAGREADQISPFMQRYAELRAETDALLAFQMGAFFEFYGEDARIVAAACDIALTQRGQVTMCGLPASAEFSGAAGGDVTFVGSSAPYFAAILAAGHSVAVCPQANLAERAIVATFRPEGSGASKEVLKQINDVLREPAKQNDTQTILAYVNDLQQAALDVQSLLEGVKVLLPERQALDACELMVADALQKAHRLNLALDWVNLPKG